MTDRYEKIRQALAMGPTPGPFSSVRSYSPGNQELIIRLTCNDEYGITENYCTVRNSLGDTWKTEANAAYIAACDPDTIRALLEERDALVEALAAQQPAGRVHDLAAQLVDELDGLVGESDGVSGLHLNGDVATWDDLLPGGRFERLSSLDELRAALAQRDEEGERK